MTNHQKYYNREKAIARQKRYRGNPAGHLCECGQPAVAYRSSDWLCAEHIAHQDREAFEALHKPTCGVPGAGGLAEYALHLPSEC